MSDVYICAKCGYTTNEVAKITFHINENHFWPPKIEVLE